MSEDAPSRNLEKFVVRMPQGMRDEIAKAAEASGRSMNAEIVYRLESFLGETSIGALQAEIDRLRERVEDAEAEKEEALKEQKIRLMEILSSTFAMRIGDQVSSILGKKTWKQEAAEKRQVLESEKAARKSKRQK